MGWILASLLRFIWKGINMLYSISCWVGVKLKRMTQQLTTTPSYDWRAVCSLASSSPWWEVLGRYRSVMGIKWHFRAKCKIIQSYWECAHSVECPPALYSLTLQGSGCSCFLKPRWATDRHVIAPREEGLYALLFHASIKLSVHLCYKHQRGCFQSPGLLAARQCHLAVVGEDLHCALWGPCTINVVLIALPAWIPQFLSLHQLYPAVRKDIDAIRSKWLQKL